MAGLFVRMENPETGGVWDCPVDSVDWHKSRGWVESDKPLAGEGEPEPPPDLISKAPKDAPAREAKPSKSTQAKATTTPPKE